MSIDWLTVAAQIVNFLILVWLLKRFLYQRVIDAMDRRERHIAERLAEARRRADEAKQEAEAYRQKSHELEVAHERALAEVEAEAERLRSERRDALRAEIEATRQSWLQQVERDRKAFLEALRKQAALRFVALARRALADLANADLEAQMVTVFLERLRDLDQTTVEAIAAACRRSARPLVVTSASELPGGLRRRLADAIHGRFGADLQVAYETSADMSCGIELSGGGRSVQWSLDGYLDSFEAALASALEEIGARADRARPELAAGLSHA